MKYFRKLYASCEPTKQQIDEWLKELRKFIDTLYALSHVSKSEIQRITGIGTHTCFDTVRNFRFKTLATFFKAAEQVCEIDFDVTTLQDEPDSTRGRSRRGAGRKRVQDSEAAFRGHGLPKRQPDGKKS